jgi:hypothetical protein
MTAGTRRSPMRWRARRQRSDERGNNMTNFIWRRDNGQDEELVRDGEVLATVKPDGRWYVESKPTRQNGKEASVEQAKTVARKRASEVQP